MRPGYTKLEPRETYFKARYQCEGCGYTGYRSMVHNKTDGEWGHNTLRYRAYCAGNCDAPNQWHRLVEIEWTDPVPLPTGNPCLLDGHRFHAQEERA